MVAQGVVDFFEAVKIQQEQYGTMFAGKIQCGNSLGGDFMQFAPVGQPSKGVVVGGMMQFFLHGQTFQLRAGTSSKNLQDFFMLYIGFDRFAIDDGDKP